MKKIGILCCLLVGALQTHAQIIGTQNYWLPQELILINGAESFDTSSLTADKTGDLNGDGLDDVILGAHGADPNGDKSGAAYVVYTNAPTKAVDLSIAETDNGAYGFVINGAAAGDETGVDVAGLGDVNGDGIPDLAVGAYRADRNGFQSGAAYVVFGKMDTTPVNLADINNDIGGHGFVINGADANDRFGISVSNIGDVNGDGLSDLLVGSRNASPYGRTEAGAVYVVFGKASTTAVEAADIENEVGNFGFVINGPTADDEMGQRIDSGDVNGDGVPDILIGSETATVNGVYRSGAAYVVFGKATTTAVDILDLNNNVGGLGYVIMGPGAIEDRLGSSIANVGDLNGDNLIDFAIGASGKSSPTRTDNGATYVVFGKATTTPIDASDIENEIGGHGFVIYGAVGTDSSGRNIGSNVGDVNADGIRDILLGVQLADPNSTSSGSAYLVFGKSDTSPIDLLDINNNTGGHGFAIHGADTTDFLGYSSTGLDDINGDGFADFLVGAYTADPNGKTAAGTSYVIYGKADTNPIEASDLEAEASY